MKGGISWHVYPPWSREEVDMDMDCELELAREPMVEVFQVDEADEVESSLPSW